MILPLFFGASIWGSKNFTEIPHRSLQAAGFSAARFAPRSPQSLEASFRGAKTSQQFCAAICHRRLLLAPPRRQSHISPSGHANRAPQNPPAGRSCWRRPAGKAIYHRRATPTGRPKFRPAADHVGAAPPAKPYTTVGPRQQGAPNSACRPIMLAPPRRQSHISPSGPANRAPKIPTGGRPCWRCPAGKAIYHRRATPTGRPKTRLPANHVGAAPPTKPYTTVGPRQQGAPKPACRPTMLAPPRRQSHISPSDHANRAPKIPPGGRPCWRRPAGKAIYHRRATPTGRHKFRPAADHVGAVPPAKPYITVGSRQQGAQNPARRPTMLAPPRRQSHISPSGHANRAPRL